MLFAATLFWVAAEVLVGIVLSSLSWSRVRDWFTQALSRLTEDPNHVYLSLHQKLKTGKHRVVYGVFNRQTATFVEGEAVTSDHIDSELAAFHEGSPLVVYN